MDTKKKTPDNFKNRSRSYRFGYYTGKLVKVAVFLIIVTLIICFLLNGR